jgi:hypothetical protein
VIPIKNLLKRAKIQNRKRLLIFVPALAGLQKPIPLRRDDDFEKQG